MKEIIAKMRYENNIYRLTYRILKQYGQMDIDYLAVSVGHALCRVFPDKCSNIDQALVYLTMQYRTNLQIILATIQSFGYLQTILVGLSPEYRAIDPREVHFPSNQIGGQNGSNL